MHATLRPRICSLRSVQRFQKDATIHYADEANPWSHHSYSSIELRHLASATGLLKEGSKADIMARLHKEVLASKSNGDKLRNKTVLSIDMGIKNFAYARIATQPGSFPLIIQWHCESLLPPKSLSESDAFSPQKLSARALSLLNQLLFKSDLPMPDFVLIERQRWRTGNAPTIQEWTYRVNMLEAMLWAHLTSAQAYGKFQGSIQSVSPALVSSFWKPGEDPAGQVEQITEGDNSQGKRRSSRKTSADVKQAKIAILRSWLNDKTMIQTSDSPVMKSLVEQILYGRRRQKVNKDEEEKIQHHESYAKIDDLTDCVLQGTAWIKWQENKRIMAEEGPGALLPERNAVNKKTKKVKS